MSGRGAATAVESDLSTIKEDGAAEVDECQWKQVSGDTGIHVLSLRSVIVYHGCHTGRASLRFAPPRGCMRHRGPPWGLPISCHNAETLLPRATTPRQGLYPCSSVTGLPVPPPVGAPLSKWEAQAISDAQRSFVQTLAAIHQSWQDDISRLRQAHHMRTEPVRKRWHTYDDKAKSAHRDLWTQHLELEKVVGARHEAKIASWTESHRRLREQQISEC